MCACSNAMMLLPSLSRLLNPPSRSTKKAEVNVNLPSLISDGDHSFCAQVTTTVRVLNKGSTINLSVRTHLQDAQLPRLPMRCHTTFKSSSASGSADYSNLPAPRKSSGSADYSNLPAPQKSSGSADYSYLPAPRKSSGSVSKAAVGPPPSAPETPPPSPCTYPAPPKKSASISRSLVPKIRGFQPY
jgi:hypothetical protein